MNKKTRSTKSEKWRHTCNSVEIAWTNEQKVAVTSYGRNKNHDEIKKHSRTSPDVQFKEFPLTKQRNWTYNGILVNQENHLEKKTDQKFKKKQKINIEMLANKKSLAINGK